MEEESTPLGSTNGQTGSWHPTTPITPTSPALSRGSTPLPTLLTPSRQREATVAHGIIDEITHLVVTPEVSVDDQSFPSDRYHISDPPRNVRDEAQDEDEAKLLQVDLRGLEYTAPVDENLVCPVCRTPFVEPVTTSCDHVFCKECFEQAYQIAPLCPIDRKRLRPPNHVGTTARIITNQLDALEVKCPNSTEGCTKTPARSMVQNHVDRYCEYSLVDCSEDTCARKIWRKDVSRGCLHWLAICPDCSESLFEADMEHHRQETCRERKMNCEDCDLQILRCQVNSHKLQCEEVTTVCQWAVYGCIHHSKRKDLLLHMPNCAFSIMGPVFESLRNEIDSLKTEVQTLNERDKAKDRRIRFLESYKNAPSYGDAMMDIANIPDSMPLGADTAPYDSRDQYLLSLLENQESKVDQLSAGMTELEAKQTVMLFNETIPIKEQLAELRSAQGVIGCHVRWLMNLRLQERRPGVASAPAGTSRSESSGGPSSVGPGLQPRRLSDTRENITKL